MVFTLSAVSALDAAATPFSLEIVVTAESSRLPRLRVAVSVSILTVEPDLRLKLLGLPPAKEPAVGDLVTVASVPTPYRFFSTLPSAFFTPDDAARAADM